MSCCHEKKFGMFFYVENRQRIEQLATKRNEDAAVFNDWVETWNEIPSLSQRISHLESLGHRHFWQDVEGEQD